jgi:plastocyanin
MTRSRPSVVAPLLVAGLAISVFALSRCSGTTSSEDSGNPTDSGSTGNQDSGTPTDSGSTTGQDSGTATDSGSTTQDSGPGNTDAGPADSGSTTQDSGPSNTDAGPADSGSTTQDAGGCTGTELACDGGCLPAGSCCGDATCANVGAGYICLPDGQCTTPACGATVNGCTTFTDLTGMANPAVAFVAYSYTPKCAQIRVGQSVTFSGTFSFHPLFQTCGPALSIAHTSSGSTATFSFADTGLYGYWCENHHATQNMVGALNVIP